MADDSKPSSIKHEVLDKISALIAAAFGLVAALAWNEAIKAVFREFFGPNDQVGPMIGYAIVVTVLAVIITLFVARATSKAKSLITKTYKCQLCDYTSEKESDYIEHLKTHTTKESDK